MNNYYASTVFPYISTMLQVRILLRDGIITAKEYDRFEDDMRVKYSLPERSIFRMKSLDIKWFQS